MGGRLALTEIKRAKFLERWRQLFDQQRLAQANDVGVADLIDPALDADAQFSKTQLVVRLLLN